MSIENGHGIEAVGIGEPTIAAGGDAGESPAHVIAAADFRFFCDQQAQKCPADISKAYDGKVIGRNVIPSGTDEAIDTLKILTAAAADKDAAI
jgi:hypothetical protein